MTYLEKALAALALFFTITLLEAIAIERVVAGPLTEWHWRRIKNGKKP
jgi:hypothetical protein